MCPVMMIVMMTFKVVIPKHYTDHQQSGQYHSRQEGYKQVCHDVTSRPNGSGRLLPPC